MTALLERLKAFPQQVWGIALLATAAAMLVATQTADWRVPFVAFLGIVAAAMLVRPIVSAWMQQQAQDEDRPYSWTIPLAIVVALCVLIFYRVDAVPATRNTVVVLLLIAAAATIVGVLLGFLFGIPRVAARGASADAANGDGPQLETNTNLEAISDWLTKIIIGVSLVRAKEIAGAFDQLLDNLAKYDLPRPLMGGLLIFFLVAGFLNGYLWTRLILTRYFSMSERALRESSEYYEGLMNAYLYQGKPQGFRKVIKLFDQYAKRFGEPGHARLWVYLACAYGQEYEWKRNAEGLPFDSPALRPTVEKALEAIQSARGADPIGARLLKTTTTRDGPDEDLRMMYDEQPEVRAAINSMG